MWGSCFLEEAESRYGSKKRYLPSELWVNITKRAITWRPRLYCSSSLRPEPQTREDRVVRALSKAGGLWLNHGFP